MGCGASSTFNCPILKAIERRKAVKTKEETERVEVPKKTTTVIPVHLPSIIIRVPTSERKVEADPHAKVDSAVLDGVVVEPQFSPVDDTAAPIVDAADTQDTDTASHAQK